jgi:hypothetical protein
MSLMPLCAVLGKSNRPAGQALVEFTLVFLVVPGGGMDTGGFWTGIFTRSTRA